MKIKIVSNGDPLGTSIFLVREGEEDMEISRALRCQSISIDAHERVLKATLLVLQPDLDLIAEVGALHLLREDAL